MENSVLIESFDVEKTNGATHTLTTDVGSLASAFVKNNNNTRKGSAGLIGNTGNLGPRDASMAAELTATDTITFRNGNGTQKMMGEVWRYVGPIGGANEFIVRGRFAITLADGVASNSAAISGIVDENDCVPFVAGYTATSVSTSDYDGATFAVRTDGSGNVVVSRRNTGGSITVYVTVVEFTGSNWSIGYGASASHDASREEITLTTRSGGAYDHGDWATAFIEATGQGDTSETGLGDTMFVAEPGTATNKVYVDYQTYGDGVARNDGTAYVYCIANTSMIVTRDTFTNLGEGNGSYGTNLSFPAGASTARNLNELALEWFVDTTGTGTAHARASIAARITDATGVVRHWVHRSGNDIDGSYAVIDLSQLLYTPESDSPSSSPSSSASSSPSDSVSDSPSDSVSDSASDSPSDSVSSSVSDSVSSSPSTAPHPGGSLKRWNGTTWEGTTGYLT